VGVVDERRAVGRLEDSRDGSPAAYLTVRATDLHALPSPVDLTPTTRANDVGLFVLTYQTQRQTNGEIPNVRLRIQVFADQHDASLPITLAGSDDFQPEIELSFPADKPADTTFRVQLPRVAGDPLRPAPAILDTLKGARTRLPAKLHAFLDENGFSTLDDVLRSAAWAACRDFRYRQTTRALTRFRRTPTSSGCRPTWRLIKN
jgi:hypothetical protein